MRRLLPLAFLALATPLLAQSDPAVELVPPRTRLEAFALQEGAVIVLGYSRMGEVRGFGSSVVVESKEFTNVASGQKERGLTIEVRERARPEREFVSYVDDDEIPSLLKGLEYLVKVDRSATPFDSFQADYRTRGELQVSTYSTDGGAKVAAAVSSGTIRRATAVLTLNELDSIRTLVEAARAALEKSRSAAN